MAVDYTPVPARDVVAIEQVLAQVGHLYDARAWDQLASVYSENVAVDRSLYGPGIYPLHGLPAVVAAMAQSWHPRAHLLSVIALRPGGRLGEVRAFSQWIGVIEDGSVHCGCYADVLRTGSSGWRICHRRYVPRLMTGLKYRDGHYQHPSASPAPTRRPGFGPADLDSVQDALRESPPPDAHTCDVLALRALLQRCSDIVDGGKWDLLGEVLAPEAVWNASVLGPVPLRLEGVRSIVARHASGPAPLSHQLTNLDVEVTGLDEAFVRSKYLVISEAGNVASGDYLDVVARTPAGWRIVRRETRPRQQ